MWPGGENAAVFGPFINRNHMGTWLILAVPLVAGYAIGRAAKRGSGRAIAGALDTTMVWLIGSVTVMAMAAIISLSRSTALGLCAAAAFGAAVALRRSPAGAGWVATGAAAAVALVLWVPATARLVERFEKPEFTQRWARPQIWHETRPIVRDFARTGTGLGGFRTAMLVYQQSDRTFFFNQAHDQYLQYAAEGGALLLVPLACAAIAFMLTAGSRLVRDSSPMFWIRLGALSGIVGTLVQSIWETGLRLPANALLFAVAAAIAASDHRS